jgi:osmotically inducible lipoprotein OsmB
MTSTHNTRLLVTRPLVAIALVTSMMALGACTKTQRYAATGGAIGAGTGAVIAGAAGGSVAAGAVVGGAAGAVGGAVLAQ